MDLFNLPHATRVNRVIPKNAFDGYTTAKQKRLFSEQIARITWTHKISPDTVNLEAKEIKEIQVFWIEIKVNEDVTKILEIIDKSIPYNILFVVEHEDLVYISTSTKHPHPGNSNNAVVDWTFKTAWFRKSENKYFPNLKISLDFIYQDFCKQLSNEILSEIISFDQLLDKSKLIETLKKEIKKLKAGIDSAKQFNRKLELNVKLKDAEKRLDELTNIRSDNE